VIRCVVFDFDGTLVDSNQIKRQSFHDVAAEFEDGAARMKRLLEREDAGDRYWVFEQFAAGLSPAPDASILADRYTRLCEEQIVAAPEMPGAGLALKQLKANGCQLFVNSATPVEPLRRIIELRNMGSLFDGVYGAPNDKVLNIETIMRLYGASRDEVAMVGDGEADREAAEQVGCRFVAIRNPQNNFTVVPARMIADLQHLPAELAVVSPATAYHA
jgi:phosphoglycolate phosphatase